MRLAYGDSPRRIVPRGGTPSSHSRERQFQMAPKSTRTPSCTPAAISDVGSTPLPAHLPQGSAPTEPRPSQSWQWWEACSLSWHESFGFVQFSKVGAADTEELPTACRSTLESAKRMPAERTGMHWNRSTSALSEPRYSAFGGSSFSEQLDYWNTFAKHDSPFQKSLLLSHVLSRQAAGKLDGFGTAVFQKWSNSRPWVKFQKFMGRQDSGLGGQDSGVRDGTAYFFLVSEGSARAGGFLRPTAFLRPSVANSRSGP